MKVSNRLKVLRAEKGTSQLDTAIAIRIGRDRYWRIENGYQEPTDQERASLARYFGVGEQEIFPEVAA